jgi:hypothetical protein
MKFTIICFVALLVTLNTTAQTTQVSLKIIQDGKTYLPGKNEIKLQRKPFVIEVTLQNTPGVFVKADFEDSMYRLKDNEPVPDLQKLFSETMTEENYNKDKEIAISKEGWSNWSYQPKEKWSSFDKEVKIVDDHTVTGSRTVQQFYTDDQQTIKVEDIKTPLYLFFLTTTNDMKTELKRQKIKISWR